MFVCHSSVMWPLLQVDSIELRRSAYAYPMDYYSGEQNPWNNYYKEEETSSSTSGSKTNNKKEKKEDKTVAVAAAEDDVVVVLADNMHIGDGV